MKYIDIASRVDTVFAHCLKAQGYDGIIRYLDASWGRSNKCLSQFEAQQIHSANLDILLVFESCGGADAPGCDTSGVSYFTRSQGIFDAQHAFTLARDLGYPEGLPIFFAIDYDASDADLAKMRPYWEGVRDVLEGRWPVGIYGHNRACLFAQASWGELVSYYWQTAAWSGGTWLANAHVKQIQNDVSVCGKQVDLNEATIRGWHMDDTPITRAEFESYKVNLQQELDDNYAKKSHTHPTASHDHPVPESKTGSNSQ